MKVFTNNLIAITLISTSIFAADIDNVLEKQCQHIVHGNGTNNIAASGYISGLVSGQLYRTLPQSKTDLAKTASNKQNVDTACKEALNNHSTKPSFSEKLSWGIAVVLDKKYVKYRNLK